MNGRPWRLPLLLASVLASAIASFALASEQDPRLPELERVTVGFDNHYKVGCWNPIDVQLHGGTRPALGMLAVVVPDADGDATLVGTPDGRPVAVLPGETVNVRLYAKIGRELNGLRIIFDLVEPKERLEFRADTQLMSSDASAKYYVIVGARAPLVSASDLPGKTDLPEQVSLPDADGLPTRWYGYDAVDTLVLVVGDGSKLAALRPGSAQLAALKEWLSYGGRLLLVAGPLAPAALERGTGLASLVPGEVTGLEAVRDVESLEKFAGASRRIPLSARGKRLGLQAARLERPRGRVEVESGGLPLVVRGGEGFGEIVFCACDFNRVPLADWADRGKLIYGLLNIDTPRMPRKEGQQATFTNFGYNDLAGQLRGALDQFAGIKLVPFWVVGLSIVGYIVLIGPVDYFLLKRVLKRMELTWITFPAIVIVVCIAAFVAARWAKGSQLRINQVDLVDVDSSAGLLRGTSWLNVFSPRTANYDLSLLPQKPAAGGGAKSDSPALPRARPLFAWLGLPGFNWGGMSAGNSSTSWFRRPYLFAPGLDELAGVPIDVWSTKSFVGRWQAPAGELLSSDLAASADGALSGALQSRLPFALHDCLLAYDRWAWSLDELLPGKTNVPRSGKRELQAVLRGFHTVVGSPEQGARWQPAPYDVSSMNVDNILRQMMFYQAADARDYTNLSNGSQPFVDLSHELALGRAILVGKADATHRAAELLDSGEPLGGDQQRWVYYRFVMPVNKQ